jgi:hypothetical protein
MGLESYLFNIEFAAPIQEDKIVTLFHAAGMTHLIDKNLGGTINDFRSYYFEIRSEQGLTEVHCLLSPSETILQSFNLRFSVLSSKYVIDQTFKFLHDLNAFKSIRLIDTEIRNHIYRKLRKEGKVDQSFVGLNQVEEDYVENCCYIPLDLEMFKQNELAIAKRQRVLENENGMIIEGGEKTIGLIDKKGLFERFFGWIRREL